MDRPAGKHERETAIILLVNISPPAYSHLPVYDILVTLYKRLPPPLEVTVPFRFLGRQGRISRFDLFIHDLWILRLDRRRANE